MAWFVIVKQVISFVYATMKVAEELFAEVAKSGTQKKDYVLAATRGLVEALLGEDFSDALWAKVEWALSPLIDIACKALFPKSVNSASGGQ